MLYLKCSFAAELGGSFAGGGGALERKKRKKLIDQGYHLNHVHGSPGKTTIYFDRRDLKVSILTYTD